MNIRRCCVCTCKGFSRTLAGRSKVPGPVDSFVKWLQTSTPQQQWDRSLLFYILVLFFCHGSSPILQMGHGDQKEKGWLVQGHLVVKSKLELQRPLSKSFHSCRFVDIGNGAVFILVLIGLWYAEATNYQGFFFLKHFSFLFVAIIDIHAPVMCPL